MRETKINLSDKKVKQGSTDNLTLDGTTNVKGTFMLQGKRFDLEGLGDGKALIYDAERDAFMPGNAQTDLTGIENQITDLQENVLDLQDDIFGIETIADNLAATVNQVSNNRAALVHSDLSRTWYDDHQAAIAAAVAGDTLLLPGPATSPGVSGWNAQLMLPVGVSLQTNGFQVGTETTGGDCITMGGGTGLLIGNGSVVRTNYTGGWAIGSYDNAPNLNYRVQNMNIHTSNKAWGIMLRGTDAVCEFYDMTLKNSGSGVMTRIGWSSNSKGVFYNCNFYELPGATGGMVSASGGTGVFHNCTFVINAATPYVEIANGANLTFIGCTFLCPGRTEASALFRFSGSIQCNLTLQDCTVINNHSVAISRASGTTNHNVTLNGNTIIKGNIDTAGINLADQRWSPFVKMISMDGGSYQSPDQLGRLNLQVRNQVQPLVNAVQNQLNSLQSQVEGLSLPTIHYYDYNDLQNLAQNGELVPGDKYRMEYQTIHMIDDDFAWGMIHYSDLYETLELTAMSETEFYPECRSVEYPADIIRYDINDNLCEDGTTSRPGVIRYRKDTILNNESINFDFRGKGNFVWQADCELFDEFADYQRGDWVKWYYNGSNDANGYVYFVATKHSIGSVPNPELNFSEFWIKGVDLGNNPALFARYVETPSGDPTKQLMWDTTNSYYVLQTFNCYFPEYKASKYEEFKGRNNSVELKGYQYPCVLTDYDAGYGVNNNKIRNVSNMILYGPDAVEGNVIEDVSNMVVMPYGGLWGNKVKNASNLVWQGSHSYNELAENSQFIYLANYAHRNKIGKNCYNVYLGVNSADNKLGSWTDGFYAESNFYGNVFPDGTETQFIQNNSFGPDCELNTFISSSIAGNQFGSNFRRNVLLSDVINNIFSNYITNCTFSGPLVECSGGLFQNNVVNAKFANNAIAEVYDCTFNIPTDSKTFNDVYAKVVDVQDHTTGAVYAKEFSYNGGSPTTTYVLLSN